MPRSALAEHDPGLDDADPGSADSLGDGADGDELPAAVDQFDPVPLLPIELAHQHGLPVGDPVLLLRVGGDLAEGERDLVERDPRRPQRLACLDQLLEQGYDAGGMGTLEEFLAVRTGYAGHFAPAMAVMARELGIPARVAVGYLPATGPEESSDGREPFGDAADPGVFAVLPRDAHAWPELWFEGSGWVRFEPTPGTGALPGMRTLYVSAEDVIATVALWLCI